MFLSKLVLNPREKLVRRDLADCHKLHRTLMTAFPQKSSEEASERVGARAEFGLLYRLEMHPRTGVVLALVQSQFQPDWSRLPADYLLNGDNNPACKPVSESYSSLQSRMRFVFRLRANPTRKISALTPQGERKKNGQRVDIRGEENQIAWLTRKASQSGFRLLSVRVNADALNVRANPEGKATGWHVNHWDDATKKARLTFGSVLFEGQLEITDAELFRKALAQGIGSGKAYGFGLLSIARVL